MIPLPLERVADFEAWLGERWTWSSWYVRRGAMAISFGMLGLRWSEVEVMEPGDLDPGGGWLYVRTRKRGSPRRIEAPQALLCGALLLRRQADAGADRVFVRKNGRGMRYEDMRRFTAAATRKVFGRAFTFHCFRHTAAIRVYQRTADVLAVQRYLGHKSLQWTNAYLISLQVLELGGPVAFCGGGPADRPRLYDPEKMLGRVAEVQPGQRAPRVAMARRRSHGKAAGGGDQEAFEWDERAERSGCDLSGVEAGEVVTPGRFEKGGAWAGLSMAEAAKVYAEEREKMTPEERAMADVMAEEEGERRLKAAALGKCGHSEGKCTHSELVQRRAAAGRYALYCKLCGRLYGYVQSNGGRVRR